MKSIRNHFATLACLLFAAATHGQISFSNQTALLQNPTGVQSDIAVAIADMNGDGLDDIVRLDGGTQLSIEYQTADGLPFGHYEFGMVSQEGQWSMSTADMNNDGYCDIVCGGFYDGVHLLTAVNDGTGYLAGILPGDPIFLQGSNFADVNNDGHLDIFGCHDDGASHLWMNDGTGVFPAESANSVINFDITDNNTVPAPSNDDSGNYGSVWTDFDNDGDLDLYVAKCRQGVDNPEDPRRINVLFVNDGQGNYSEQGEKHGLRIKWQSWTADFQDIDNDGDMDCFVTNHDYPMQLLENDGAGHFTDITEQAGVGVSGFFWQGIMRDFDNDGFVDILTATATYLFKNNGDKTFTEVPNPFGGDLATFASGDLNSDGFQDLYVALEGNGNPADRLLLNNTNNGNHFLGVRLQGVQSNRAGVGSRIEIHGNWGIQVREIRSGESYGISNSLNQHFGLGQDSVIDYLVVRWTSGVVDVVKNPAADQVLTVVEGSTCTLPAFEIELSSSNILCPGDSLTLAAPAGYQYLWNNGMASQSLTVGSAGNFSLIMVDGNGCAARSNLVQILVNPDQTPTIAATGATSFCEGDAVVLTSSEAASYAWSTGETSQSVTIAQAGEYFVTVPGACGDFTSQAVQVEVHPVADLPQAIGDTLTGGGSATLVAVGTNPYWYDSPFASEPIFKGDTLHTSHLTQTDTFYVAAVNAFGGGDFEAGMPQHQGTQFSGNNFNGQTLFNVTAPVVLRQVTVYTDQAGLRLIQLLDSNDQILQSDSADIPVGVSVVDLDFPIQPGSYKLTTHAPTNNQVLGTNSPRLRRSDAGVNYPYELPGVLTITGSNFGAAFYYYFFDWQVEVLPLYECASERVPVVVTVLPSGLEDESFFGVAAVQPNPSGGVFTLDFQPVESGATTLSVTDLTGKTVFEKTISTVKNERQVEVLDLSGTASGTYFLRIGNGERVGRWKLVKE